MSSVLFTFDFKNSSLKDFCNADEVDRKIMLIQKDKTIRRAQEKFQLRLFVNKLVAHYLQCDVQALVLPMCDEIRLFQIHILKSFHNSCIIINTFLFHIYFQRWFHFWKFTPYWRCKLQVSSRGLTSKGRRSLYWQ